MASKYTGVAVLFGFKGAVSYTGVGTFIKESGDIEHDYQCDEITDDDNELVSLLHSKESYIFNMLFTLRAASGAPTSRNSAKASMAGPVKGAQVTLSAFDDGGSFINGSDWVYVGGWKLSPKKNGVIQASLKIRRSPNFDISAQPTS